MHLQRSTKQRQDYMKTIREWLNDLPEDIRVRAFRNAKPELIELEKSNLERALSGAFVWSDTIEGHEFWDLVSQCRYAAARLTLPKTIAQQLNVTEFPFIIKDKRGNVIYVETEQNGWERWEWSETGEVTYHETGRG